MLPLMHSLVPELGQIRFLAFHPSHAGMRRSATFNSCRNDILMPSQMTLTEPLE